MSRSSVALCSSPCFATRILLPPAYWSTRIIVEGAPAFSVAAGCGAHPHFASSVAGFCVLVAGDDDGGVAVLLFIAAVFHPHFAGVLNQGCGVVGGVAVWFAGRRGACCELRVLGSSPPWRGLLCGRGLSPSVGRCCCQCVRVCPSGDFPGLTGG